MLQRGGGGCERGGKKHLAALGNEFWWEFLEEPPQRVLSLLGKRITNSLVNELVIVSDEKLLELLELANVSRHCKDVGLIMDIIAGSYAVVETKPDGPFIGDRSLNETELESERSTWFTATLLQLGSVPSSDYTQSSSSRRQSCKTTEDDPSSGSRDISSFKHKCIDSGKLCDIWACCIERCHFKTLRQLLHDPRKFVSISEVQGVLVAYVAFGDEDVKLRVERCLSSVKKSHIDILTEGNGVKERRWDNPGQRIESIIRQQRLETAWLQTAG
ncbi:hypothetical protein P8452_58332 [Trifolium repens]|nr:hypothetical protein P8452_58332 [Trifolium repens]